jgi:outer membrane protein OmpA-like peptidoglycan-associated protein
MVARMVGKQHTGDVVWELTADSLSTLKTSFKELADALARTSEQQALWRHIQSMPQGEAKDKKTLAFVKAVLQKESFFELDKLAGTLLSSQAVIEIRGHTDNAGNEKDNQKLSEERAKEIKEELVRRRGEL